MQPEHDAQGQDESDQARVGQADAQHVQALAGVSHLYGAFIRREKPQGKVLDDEGQAKTHQQRVLDLGITLQSHDVPVDGAVHHQAHDEQRGDHNGKRKERIEAEGGEGPIADVASEHQQFAMRDVEHLEHAEDKRQANGRHAVDAPDKEAEDKRLCK